MIYTEIRRTIWSHPHWLRFEGQCMYLPSCSFEQARAGYFSWKFILELKLSQEQISIGQHSSQVFYSPQF